MTKHTEVMKLALEALEESLGYVQEEAENAQRLYGQYPARQARIQGLKDDARKHMDAITALREALTSVPDWASEAIEQPAQSSKPFDTHAAPGRSFDTHSRTPQQEPVAWIEHNDETSEPCPSCGKPLQSAAGGGVVCSGRCGYWFCF